MTPTESTARRLASVLLPQHEVWTASAPRWRTTPERHYVLCGRTRYAHRTIGTGATPADAWADAEATLRREIADAVARERRDRDRAQAEIERLTAALEVSS